MGTQGGFGASPNHLQCTAISKRSQVRCKGPAILGSPNQKCRMHGGASEAIGTRNKAFKDGRHSKYLPPKLDELYREALDNPELTDMADHIALLEAHMQEILAVSAAGEPAPKWVEVKEQFDLVATAALGGKPDEVVKAVEGFYTVLEAGEKWDRTWNEVIGLMEQLRKMTDTDVKRKKELNQMVPVERVMILMAAVGAAVKRNVTNPAEIQAVQRELIALTVRNKTPAGVPLVEQKVIDV